jgi:hypothetical protein
MYIVLCRRAGVTKGSSEPVCSCLLCVLCALLLDGFITHAHNTSDAVSCSHVLKSLVDLIQWLPMGDELVNLESTL